MEVGRDEGEVGHGFGVHGVRVFQDFGGEFVWNFGKSARLRLILVDCWSIVSDLGRHLVQLESWQEDWMIGLIWGKLVV
jgi:hypothetical protein